MDAEGQGHAPLAFLLRAWRRRGFAEARVNRAYAAWLRRERVDLDAWRALVAGLRGAPRFSVVMPVRDTPAAWLLAAVASVQAQVFSNWELVLADDASTAPHMAGLLAECARDRRVDVVRLARPGGVSAATNAALRAASGDYVAFLDHDDVLAPHALAAMACEIAGAPDLDMLFSDEDQLIDGRRAAPYFKPGFNPDLLLSQNFVNHLAVYRRDFLSRLGGLRGEFDGAQDHDLALRAMDAAGMRRIRHVPGVLYHWRQSAGAQSAAAAARCRDAAARAVAAHLGTAAEVSVDPALPQWPRVRFRAPDVRVSVIGAAVPGCEAVASADQATGGVLLFLSPALRPVTTDWLAALVGQALRPEIGAAGARLEGPDGRVVHAGYALDAGTVESAQGDGNDPGYRGQLRLARSVAAVSLDCLAVRADVFRAAGGLNMQAGDFAGVDLCLRLAARGYRTVWEPASVLRYAALPRPLGNGAGWMRATWGALQDPYGNPALQMRAGVLGLRQGQ